MHRQAKQALLAALTLSFAFTFIFAPVEAAHAQTPEGLRLSGYGTLGYVQDNRSDITAIRDVSQRPNHDFGQGSWRRDTRFGLQAEYHLNSKVALVGQAVFRDQVSTAFDHAIEMAYVGLKPTAYLDVRLGRVGYDAFMMSDTRNIGYAYPWVRPFTEYYGWIPLFSVDGVDAAYTMPLGDAQWRIKAQAGQSNTGIPIGATGQLDFKATQLLNLTVSRHAGPWHLKAGYSRFISANEVSPGDLTTLQAGLDAIANATAGMAPAISSEAANLRQHLSFKDSQITYVTLGATFDDGHWLLQGELARTTASHKIVPHGTMGYAVLGYRLGDWMPFLAISASRPGNSLRSPTADWSGIGQTATQATALAILNSTRMDQQTVSIGTRWDFQNRAALKLQWDTTRIAAQGYGLLFKNPALNGRTGRMNQLTLTLDFIF